MLIILCSFLILPSNFVILTAYRFYLTTMKYSSSTDFLNGAVTRVLLLIDRPSYVYSMEQFNQHVCGTVSSMLSGLKTRSLGLNALGTTLSPASSQSVQVGRPSTASCVQPVVSQVNVTCSRPQRNVHRSGFEPGTPWSEIRRTNHCATPPPFNQHQSIYACFVRLNLNQNFLSKY